MFKSLLDRLLSDSARRITGSLIGLLVLIATIIGIKWPSLRLLALVGALALALAVVFARDCEAALKWSHAWLVRAVPYLVLVGFLVSIYQFRVSFSGFRGQLGGSLSDLTNILREQGDVTRQILSAVSKASPTVEIEMTNDQTVAGLYNHWSRNAARDGYTHVFTSEHAGNTWLFAQEEKSTRFSFLRHRNFQKDSAESSGGYITFYKRPLSRLVYKYLSFYVKVSEASGKPDFGIRLALDDPILQGDDREVVIYEVPSLGQLAKASLNTSWQRFELYIWQFEEVPARHSFPIASGVDANNFNKLVFFVTDTIPEQCDKATFWFRDIVFTEESHK